MQKQYLNLEKTVSILTAFFFLINATVLPGFAQEISLPKPGTMVVPTARYAPATILGLITDAKNPFHLNFIVDTGNSGLTAETAQPVAKILVKYFLAALTIPDDQKWVNLSPYESDRIIPDVLGNTDLGRDMLAQDYMLKQFTSSLMYPESELGQKFWDRVYAKAAELYGTTNIPINALNKVWITPDRATVYEYGTGAFVVEKHLKVYLEKDYLALKNREDSVDPAAFQDQERLEMVNSVAENVVREILVPEIEREVNEGEIFSNLRQIYNAMILATWYRKALKESLLGRIYSNQNKVAGILNDDPDVKNKIYDQYLQAFQVGVYDFLRNDYDPQENSMVTRKYFSGGVVYDPSMLYIKIFPDNKSTSDVFAGAVRKVAKGFLLDVPTDLIKTGKDFNAAMLSPGDMSKQWTPDVRPGLVKKLKERIPEGMSIGPSGFSSIDISAGGDKSKSLDDVFTKEGKSQVLYFGNEFFEKNGIFGNDVPVLFKKEQMEREGLGKKIIVFSVDKSEDELTDYAKNSDEVIWIGPGEEATVEVLRLIIEALEAGQEEITIYGKGGHSYKSVTIDIRSFLRDGIILMDIDGTLLEHKTDNFENKPVPKNLISCLLNAGISSGFVTGKSRHEQFHRTVKHLIGTIRDPSLLKLYANGGLTLQAFNHQGSETIRNLVKDIPAETINSIKQFLLQEMKDHFSLDEEAWEAWKVWFRVIEDTGTRSDMPLIEFDFNPEKIDVVSPEDMTKKNRVSFVYIELKDGVQLSIKLLPKAVRYYTPFQKKVMQFMGVSDLVEELRLRDVGRAENLVNDFFEAVYQRLVSEELSIESMGQKDFNRLFGLRQVVAAAGEGTRFSKFLQKTTVHGLQEKTNLQNAIEGSHLTPGINPIIAISDKILGDILKDEFIGEFDREHNFFIALPDVLKRCEQEMLVSRDFLDARKVRELTGRKLDEVEFVFVGTNGHGDALIKSVEQIRKINDWDGPYVQVVFGAMAVAGDTKKSNPSLISYLQIIARNLDAVAGGRLADTEILDDGRIVPRKNAIVNKANFFLEGEQLLDFNDWDLVPHDNLFSDLDQVALWQNDYETLKEKIAALPKDQEVRKERLDLLHKEYPNFSFTFEEIYHQENLLRVLSDLRDWGNVSDDRKEIIRRHYAVVEDGINTNMLICANSGVFRVGSILQLKEFIDTEYQENGFADYDQKGEDHRSAGQFWHVYHKNGENKTVVWSFFRLIARQGGKTGVVNVENSPASVKDAKGQLALFRILERKRYVPPAIDSGFESFLNEEQTNLQSDDFVSKLLSFIKSQDKETKNVNWIGVYERYANEMYIWGSGKKEQMHINNILLGLGDSFRDTFSLNEDILHGIRLLALSRSIDRGYHGNAFASLGEGDLDYLRYISEIRKLFQTGRQEYIQALLDFIIIEQKDVLLSYVENALSSLENTTDERGIDVRDSIGLLQDFIRSISVNDQMRSEFEALADRLDNISENMKGDGFEQQVNALLIQRTVKRLKIQENEVEDKEIWPMTAEGQFDVPLIREILHDNTDYDFSKSDEYQHAKKTSIRQIRGNLHIKREETIMSLQRVPWLLAMVLKIPFETPNPGRGEMTNPDWFLENVKQPVSWEFVSDPLDPKGHADPLYVVGYHLIVRNPKTGMIYVNPQPQYDHAEEDDLIGFRTESVSPQDRYFIRNARFAKQIIQWLKDSDKDDLIGKGRLLDLGMGTGLLLCAFRDDQNWPQDQLFGVDVAPAFVDTAKREFGFENQVQVGSIENRELYEQGSFDVIVLAQTIEHLPDPKGILENIRYWLSEGGVLILMDVPNSGGLAAVGQRQRWRQFVFEEHRWHFNHETLNELLKAVGFDPVRAQNMVEGPYLTPGELPWDDIGYIGRRFGINDVENLERLKILIFQAEQKWSQEYNLSYHLPNGLREASSAKEFEEWWNRKINHSPLLGNDVSFIAVNPKGDPKTDSAQLINPGGIDLNSDYLSLQTDRAMLQSSPVPGDSFINNLEIDGLVPFISEIRQISDLEALINLN